MAPHDLHVKICAFYFDIEEAQTKMLVRGMLVTILPQVCASLLQSKHDCISKCLWLRMRA